jgi:hypothetical protein
LTTKGSERADNDGGWKEILRIYFPQAIQFFFPATAALVDWAQPVEFLDTQLRQITKEAEVGRRFADLLVKVHLLGGLSRWLLLHVEVQGAKEKAFPTRMMVYNFRIFDLFGQHPISLAILTDTNRQWRPDHYGFDAADTAWHFRFGMVKLLDFKQRIDELDASDNPFAVVVLAHLQAQDNRRDDLGRKNVKFALIRRLYERGFPRQDVINLFRFIDWSIQLPEDLKLQFWQDVHDFEEQRQMPYITSIEQIGLERGEQIGLERGKRDLILRQLTRQLRGAELPADLAAQVQALPLPQLEGLGKALLDFNSLNDLQAWLNQNAPS